MKRNEIDFRVQEAKRLMELKLHEGGDQLANSNSD
jgi:hypothetical protein